MGNLMSTSFAPECTELKQKYDSCFNKWYSEEFLKGKGIQNDCEDFWEEYRKCVVIHMQSQGLGKMVDQARKEAPFEDEGKRLDSGKAAPADAATASDKPESKSD